MEYTELYMSIFSLKFYHRHLFTKFVMLKMHK